MKKFIAFFKTPLGIGIIIVAVVGLFFGFRAIYKSNNEKALQMALDDVNTRIKKASASRGVNTDSLISEREVLISIIKQS